MPSPAESQPRAPADAPFLQSGAELLKRAEDARFAGDIPRAKVLLLELRQRFYGTEPAVRAAFELGRITFDAEHDYAKAAGWFELVLKERPSIGFAREALGRALEAKSKSGDAEGTKRHAVKYLAVYPDGPHAAFARRVLQPSGRDEEVP